MPAGAGGSSLDAVGNGPAEIRLEESCEADDGGSPEVVPGELVTVPAVPAVPSVADWSLHPAATISSAANP